MIAAPVVAVLALLSAPTARPAARPAPPKPSPTPPSLRWAKTFDGALARARAAGQPVMVDFWAEWCHYCHLLDQTTYRDPTVVEMGRRLVSVKVNAEGSELERDIARRYLVRALPTIAFLSPRGRQLLRLNGYVPPDGFPSMIRSAQEAATRVIAWETALEKDPKDVVALRELGLHVFLALQQIARNDDDGLIPKGMLADARQLLRQARALDGDRPSAARKEVRRVLGVIRSADGVVADTEALLKEALALSPPDPAEDAEAQTSLGELYLHINKRDQARALFEKTVKDYPGTAGAARAQQQLQRVLE